MGRPVIRHLPLRLLVAGAGLYPILCLGLGLGEIQMDSRLNQPLRARIEILDVSDEEWRHIQARLHRESDPETAGLHPEILDSLTVRAIQDAHDRHFIEVRSTQPLAEPLFDLPVEVAGSAGRVIRSYAVLLDPPAPGDDVQQGSAGSQSEPREYAAAGPHTAAGSQLPAARQEGTQVSAGAPTSNTRPAATARRRHARHRHSATHLAKTNLATASDRTTGAHGPEQEELLKQLEMLQQTLGRMQQTISEQNAQIAYLTAKVGRAGSKAPHSAPAAAAAQTAESRDIDPGEIGTTADNEKPRSYFWLTVALGLTTVVATSAILIKRRAARSARSVRPDSPAASPRQEPVNQGEQAARGSSKRSGTALALTTPAAQQKQMEADGRVQIDWQKELGNKPEWLRLFTEQPSTSSQQNASPRPAAAEHSGPDPEPHFSKPMAELDQADLDELADSYFADLPRISTVEVPGATTIRLPKADASEVPDMLVTEGPATSSSRLLGEETTKLANAFSAAIRERNNTGEQLATTQDDTAKLTEVDPTELLDAGMASLSEEDAARLLAADLTTLSEAGLNDLTEADLIALTKADAAKLAEAGTAEPTDEHTMPGPPRLRRRAGRH